MKLLSFFKDRDTSGADPRLARVTLVDLLTMRSGIEWHESDRPFDDTNTTLLLERSTDWIRFTLDQPMDADPGTKWVYNSGGSHLMSGIVKAATGRFIDDYAREHLFGPIGIEDFHWKKTPKGYPDTEGGLYLRAEDLARFGYLFLRGGRWEDRQVVPSSWVEAAVAQRVERVRRDGRGYGYQWWRLDRGDTEVWAGLGFGDSSCSSSRSTTSFRVRDSIEEVTLAGFEGVWGVLIDARHPRLYGGTGESWRFESLRDLKGGSGRRAFIAGGLRPGNVRAAITAAQPYGIDLCSGLEARPGKKDPELLARLFEEIRDGENSTAA